MSVTQDYKTITLSREQIALLMLSVSTSIGRAFMGQEDAVTVDIADEYAKKERELRAIFALLVAA